MYHKFSKRRSALDQPGCYAIKGNDILGMQEVAFWPGSAINGLTHGNRMRYAHSVARADCADYNFRALGLNPHDHLADLATVAPNQFAQCVWELLESINRIYPDLELSLGQPLAEFLSGFRQPRDVIENDKPGDFDSPHQDLREV